METGIDSPTYEPDPAGVFGAAHSLWEACQQRAEQDHGLTLSESYNGFDQFMRDVMRVANLFEEWACAHVDFNRMADVWPYLLLDNFGDACLLAVAPSKLAEFNEDDCLRVALRLELPILRDGKLPVPADVTADNHSSAEFGIRSAEPAPLCSLCVVCVLCGENVFSGTAFRVLDFVWPVIRRYRR